MCSFTRPVKSVTNTRIFARDSTAKMQFLAYEMQISATEDLAMILPLPVPAETREESVRFINLENFPTFFSDMDSGFPQPRQPAVAAGKGGMATMGGPMLKVITVGSFEASFVPTVEDFDRLDERFRLPLGVWDKLPQYKSYGFAVFKLKKEQNKIHPIAFEFPRADPTTLFFPTIHIHDGDFHKIAEFDHVLYAHFDGHRRRLDPQKWMESKQPAGMFMDTSRSVGLVDGNAHAYKRPIKGKYKNEDILA